MKNKAFTMMELLIVISIFVALFAGMIAAINPQNIMNKGRDAQRKKELDEAKKMLEEFMTDTGCYPQPTQICMEGNNTSPCHICTSEQPTQFPYFSKNICDPKHGFSDYMFQTEVIPGYKPPGGEYIPAGVSPCPKWFRIFSVLDGPYNEVEDVWGCKKGGCGVAPLYGYSYLVTSPGASTDLVVTNNWYCYTTDCVQCTPYENCISSINDCYGKELYASRSSCCSQHDPNSPYCR